RRLNALSLHVALPISLPILYTEFGVQTVVPAKKMSAYQAGTSPTAEEGVSAATQAAYYRKALELAYCQPTVRGLFVFHTFDESRSEEHTSELQSRGHL